MPMIGQNAILWLKSKGPFFWMKLFPPFFNFLNFLCVQKQRKQNEVKIDKIEHYDNEYDSFARNGDWYGRIYNGGVCSIEARN